jgi:hypothetical protein
MTQYYFITTLLPPLKIGQSPDIDHFELDFLLRMNLTPVDFRKVETLRRLTDIENIRHLLSGEDLDGGGNLDEKELEESIFHQEKLPSYVFEFLERYKETPERLKNFPELLRRYFQEETQTDEAFLCEYLNFEREWRLVFSSLRAKELGRSLTKEMSLEKPEEPFIAAIIEQEEDPSYRPPDEYFALKAIFDAKKLNPLELNLAVSEWRFNAIEEMTEWHTSDIYSVLGYVVQFEIVEKWLKLDKRKGIQFVQQVGIRHNA